MSEQPYYFEIVPRTIISKTFQKQRGAFKFYIYKTTQRVDFSPSAYEADFKQNRMKIENGKLNFFLANYYAGKNANAKFIFQLTKITYKSKSSQQRQVGSYVIDPNIYIQEFKRKQINHYSQLWVLSDEYSIQIQLFFDESKYLLQKILKEYRNTPATNFNKPLVSKALQQAKKIQLEQDKQYDNEERYNQKKLQLFNKYAGAIVGQGGYRIFDQEQQKLMKKASSKNQNKKAQDNKNSTKPSAQSNKIQQNKKPVQPNQPKKYDDPVVIKRTDSTILDDQNQGNTQAEMKNIKFLIIGIIVLILLGSGYFLSKLFLKSQQVGVEVSNTIQVKKLKEESKKSKAKAGKKAKKASQL